VKPEHKISIFPIHSLNKAISRIFGNQKSEDIAKLELIEANLAVSESRYDHLFKTAKSGILLIDAETGRILDINPFLVKMLGYPREQFVEKEIWRVGVLRVIAANRTEFIKFQKKDYFCYEDVPIENGDGQRIHVEFISSAYILDGHRVLQCDFRNITESKQVVDNLVTLHELQVHQIELEMQNEELQKIQVDLDNARARYFDLYDLAPVGYWTISENGRILETNLTAATLLGKNRLEMIDQLITKFILVKDQDIYYMFRKQLFETGEAQTCELRMLRNDGTSFWANLAATVAHDIFTETDKNAVSERVFRVVVNDISGRKRVEDEFAVSEMRYRRLFETAQDGILMLDAETGKIMNVNPFLIKMLGYSREQFIEKAIWEIGLFKDIAANRENFLELQKKEYIRYEDLPLETADGGLINVEFISNVYSVNNYRVIQCNIRDITDRKRMEDIAKKLEIDLNRSNKDLEQFAYVASHDLQEPLRAVAGFVGMLRKEFGSSLDIRAHEYIDMAIEGAERMRRLIQDLLSFSRVGIKGGALPSIDMKVVFDTIVKNLSVAIGESGAIVTSGTLPVINADLTQMTQLLQNIIANAIKFKGKESPEISVKAVKENGSWIFSINDNGIGIEPQYYERIFLIFQKLHSRIEYEGTGIGLALCKKIVERHEGSIRVESITGKGSTFYFTIPDRGENK
jgi:PAS domain S-box-containing protein